MAYEQSNSLLNPYHIKHVIETPTRIAHYAPNDQQGYAAQIAKKLVDISEYLWSYYYKLDTYLDSSAHSSFTEPDSLITAEKVILDKIDGLPDEYREEMLDQHTQFKNIFIKRSLRERGVPGQLNELTLLNLPLLGVFFGSKGDLLAIPTLIALKHSGLSKEIITFCSRYMRYFVRVRAIIDDIKDWKNDLQQGHLTCIHVQCIKILSHTERGRTTHLCFNLKDDAQIIKETIHQKVIPRLIDEIIHTHSEYMEEIKIDKFSSDDIGRIQTILSPAFHYLENLSEKYELYYQSKLPTEVNIDSGVKVCYSV